MDNQAAALMALGVAVALAISVHAPHRPTLPDFVALVEGIDISTHNEAAMYLVPDIIRGGQQTEGSPPDVKNLSRKTD
jgi:hypothetical protein